ncbi:PEP-CTERM sorting domain-containing protein [Uliginosibacterium sp. H3]|uniref:PEP-CTERM sorting domain-containing protein n=1 Tax=Uliginosibacterium silvisoli TaxID=3114758 RepID=A0ABU6K2I8_9RHOO|nr:PEP-CTERM sorting domain-containing protein [Uliginosibacterium sp. H3]MEC5386018.1 PEP-CTERM sorting domain-containing protein [Uliginosibacterium sp. H3]
MIKRTLVATAMAFALASGGAHAANVIDTGTPTGYTYSFNKNDYFAGEFSFAGAAVIDSIQAYFSTASGNVAISVFSDAGGLPGSALYSTTLATTAGGLSWNGVSGLDWAVAANTNYWVVFAPDYSATLAVAPEVRDGAPSPMAAYALYHDYSVGVWQANEFNQAYGVRIGATVAAVPEPAGIAMYALGLAGLAVVARRRKQA